MLLCHQCYPILFVSSLVMIALQQSEWYWNSVFHWDKNLKSIHGKLRSLTQSCKFRMNFNLNFRSKLDFSLIFFCQKTNSRALCKFVSMSDNHMMLRSVFKK